MRVLEQNTYARASLITIEARTFCPVEQRPLISTISCLFPKFLVFFFIMIL